MELVTEEEENETVMIPCLISDTGEEKIKEITDKVRNSEFIVVGKVLPDMALEVRKVIKGNLQLAKVFYNINYGSLLIA